MKKRIPSCLAAFALAALFIVPARANLVTNGSFEAGAFVDSGDGAMALNNGSSGPLTGWTVVNGDIAWLVNGSYDLDTPYGSRFLDLTGYQTSPLFGGVSQTIATTVGQTYALSFAVGYEGEGYPFGGPVSVEAYANATSLGTATTGSNSSSGTTWTTYAMNFTATSSSTAIRLIGQTGVYFIGLDNVEVNAVPEPATLSVAGVAIGATLVMRRRRRVNR